MDDKELVNELRGPAWTPSGTRPPSPRELEAADYIEALTAKAEALAEALRKIGHLPDCNGETESYRWRQDQRNTAIAKDWATAALKAWEE